MNYSLDYDTRHGCAPFAHKGERWPSLSWALPDVYARRPLASDADVGRWLGVSRFAVRFARERAGIPSARRRCALNCYAERS